MYLKIKFTNTNNTRQKIRFLVFLTNNLKTNTHTHRHIYTYIYLYTRYSYFFMVFYSYTMKVYINCIVPILYLYCAKNK